MRALRLSETRGALKKLRRAAWGLRRSEFDDRLQTGEFLQGSLGNDHTILRSQDCPSRYACVRLVQCSAYCSFLISFHQVQRSRSALAAHRASVVLSVAKRCN